jgi:hypothetical protein
LGLPPSKLFLTRLFGLSSDLGFPSAFSGLACGLQLPSKVIDQVRQAFIVTPKRRGFGALSL